MGEREAFLKSWVPSDQACARPISGSSPTYGEHPVLVPETSHSQAAVLATPRARRVCYGGSGWEACQPIS